MIDLKSDFLKKDILDVLNKNSFDEVSDNDIKGIKALNLDYFSNLNNDYDLTEISIFEGLEDLYLKDFLIGQREIEALNKLSSLKSFYIEFCEFEENDSFFDFPKIEQLTINMCDNFSLKYIKDTSAKVIFIKGNEEEVKKCDLRDISSIPDTSELSIINYCILSLNLLNYVAPNLRFLNISGSVYSKEDVENLSQKIEVVNEEIYRQEE